MFAHVSEYIALAWENYVGEDFNNLLYFLHILWLKFEFWICYLFHVL